MDTLPQLKNALISYVTAYNERGNRGIKLAHAYERTLSSETVSGETASIIYEKSLRGETLSNNEVKQFQDTTNRSATSISHSG